MGGGAKCVAAACPDCACLLPACGVRADMDVAVWALGNMLTAACPRPALPPHSRAAYAKRRNVVLILMLSGSIVLSIIYHLNGEC